MEIILEVQAVN